MSGYVEDKNKGILIIVTVYLLGFCFSSEMFV